MNGILWQSGKQLMLPAVFLFIFLPPVQAGATGKDIAAPDAAKPPFSKAESGVVTGQLVTVAGNTFFQYFIAHWRDQALSERYSITVHERPSAMRGSQIRIESSNRVVFMATLPNSRGDLKSFAERAVEIAYQNAADAEIQRLLFRDADLAPDEF